MTATPEQPPIRVTDDAYLDVEPSIIAVNINGVPWTTTAAIKYIPVAGYTDKLARNHFATTSDFIAFTRGELPMVAGYSRSADPLMSANLYDAGIAPRRMYVVGNLHNADSNLYSAIGVWRSDNGGQTWSQPTLAEIRGGGGYLLDKPAIGVSWHSGTLGYVYVAYVSIDFHTNNNALVIERSTDGGLSFGNPFVIAYGGAVTAPQIVVNSSSGAVHVLWADETNRDIRMATSNDYGLSFGAHEIVSSIFHVGTIFPGMKGGTYPAARFHWPSGRIIVAWHGDGTSATDVYYSYKPCAVNCNPFGWRNPIQVNDSSINDQFMPGIDFTGNNVVIAFYDRRHAAGDRRYHEYYALQNIDGTLLEPNKQISESLSDPDAHQLEDGADRYFIGDYQDLWTWSYPYGERAVPAFILIPSGNNGEVYVSRISY